MNLIIKTNNCTIWAAAHTYKKPMPDHTFRSEDVYVIVIDMDQRDFKNPHQQQEPRGRKRHRVFLHIRLGKKEYLHYNAIYIEKVSRIGSEIIDHGKLLVRAGQYLMQQQESIYRYFHQAS